MSETVLDAIAAEVAALSRDVESPAAPFGYGTDLSCTTELTERIDEVDADSPIGTAEALIRRLSTERGTLTDDVEYGLDVVSLLNRGVDSSGLPELEGDISLELVKDDRVESVDVTVVIADSYRSLNVSVRFTPVDPLLDTVSMTLAVTSSGVILEAIS